MDYLVLGSFLVEKAAQAEWKEVAGWKQEFQLD
jgi:hypothetical protein